MAHSFASYQPYFDDPRLRMTLAGRFLVRAVSRIGHFFLGAAIFMLAIQDFRGLRAMALLLFIFLVDLFLRRGSADRPLYELPREGAVNTSRYLAPTAFRVIERTFDRATLTREPFTLGLLVELLGVPEVRRGLERLDISLKDFEKKARSFLEDGDHEVKMGAEEKGGKIQELMIQAFRQATENKHDFILPTDLFAALPSSEDELVRRLFITFSLEPKDLERALLFGATTLEARGPRRIPTQFGAFLDGSYKPIRHRIMNRAWTSRPTPTLDKFSTDFTDLARQAQIGFLVGHEEEYERLVNTLARPINPNALIVGEVGSGKETIVARLALDLIKDKVPPGLFDKRLVQLHLTNMVAGAPPDELQNRIKKIVEEIFIAGNVVLFIPDIHNLVQTSGTAYLSAADALMPIFQNNLFPTIGATYPREFKEHIESRSDFLGLFEVIRVAELKEEEAEKLLVYVSVLLEKQFGVVISFGAIKEAVRLAKKYVRDKLLPSSAEELLKDAVVEVQRRGERFVGPEAVIKMAEVKVHIPIHEATKGEAQELLNLEKSIHERFIDQEEAVKVIADAIREYRSGLARKGGPIATFLFLGPTGVGKTELSKILARVQFGSEDLMLRFDMSEYQTPESLYRLIGSPDGKTRGDLTDAVLERPYSLVLLDEFEKAHSNIWNIFLQVFDDGRLTDNFGRVVDFQNTIVIATSNAHSDIMMEALRGGETMLQVAEYIKTKLADVFKPELLNRFTRIVVFRDLSLTHMAEVAKLNLSEVAKALEDQGVKIVFDEEVVKEIARKGYDPSFGARPLRRVIEESVRAPLAERLLKKEVARGDTVRVELHGEEISFVRNIESSS